MTTSEITFMSDATPETPHIVVEHVYQGETYGTAYPIDAEKGCAYLSAYDDWRWSGDDESFVPKGYVEVERKYLPKTEDCDQQETPVIIWFVPEGEEAAYYAKAAGVTVNSTETFATLGDAFARA